MRALVTDYYQDLCPDNFDFCEDVTPKAENCQKCFQGQFYDGNDVNYECLEKRILYILRYFPVHAEENKSGMRLIPDDVIDEWFESGFLRLLSLGGGPGSDIYGVLKHLEEESEERGQEIDIEIVRADMENQWDDIFEDIMERFFPEQGYRSIHLNVNNGLDDVGQDDFDLVTTSYLVSELSAEESVDLASEIDGILNDSGVLLINDRSEDCVKSDIKNMYDEINIEYNERELSTWSNFNYPNEISDRLFPRPKFSMSSAIFVGVKQ